ncbi:MAG: LytTR family transcriptional regulator DNA-binding domain-containing protein, partial [Oscillospiraceae bacterium]
MKELCDSGKRIFVIFVSSHENYVHNAWDYHPYSFISKANLDYKLERNLLDIHKEYISRHKTVLLNTEKGFYSLDLKNLEYAEVDRNNLILHLIEGDSVEIRETISRIADEWTVYGIVRAHKSYLVNVQYIFSLENKTLRLQSGAIVDVSRKCREDLQKAYREWMRYEQ